jgi:antitoxin (DNA-binding transcriptional repressor) of toxin-antitoxin stability system
MYTVHQAKTNLSRLIKEACNGSDVIIARGKHPVVKLVPLGKSRKKRVSGRLKGKIRIGREFFKPLTKAELREWGLE